VSELYQTFSNNLLPILLIAGAGFALGKFLKVEPRPLGRIIFYILSPVLVFNLIIDSQLPLEEIGLLFAITAAVIMINGLLAWALGRLMRLERPILIGLILTSMFINAGNYGLPVVSFAFGEEALAFASIFFVGSAILLNTVGVLIASLGHLDIKRALLGLLRVPYLYAVVAGLVFLDAGWVLPKPIERAVDLVAGGAVPAMIILLGLELTRVEWSKHIGVISASTFLRLVVGPIVGWGLSAVSGLPTPAHQAVVIESGMPSAVMVTILANEYQLESRLITATVFISTILSPLTLTPLLLILGR
jgi:hypothetical protein